MTERMHTLVVDDEKSICFFLSETLQRVGHTVVTANSGEEALNLLRDTGFDLAMLDLRLGGRVDGLRVLEAIKWRWPETVVIILTAHGSLESAIDAIREGVEVQMVRDEVARGRAIIPANVNHPESEPMIIPVMRREIKPFCVDVDHEEDILRAKELLIDNACKGRNDLLATYVNKPIENFITARLASTSITPNQITILTNVVAYAATILFAKGYLLVGSLVTFIVSFMDGVDGKLSRVKMAGSNLGKMEHAIFVFPVAY